jgi:hypothetical protein
VLLEGNGVHEGLIPERTHLVALLLEPGEGFEVVPQAVGDLLLDLGA